MTKDESPEWKRRQVLASIGAGLLGTLCMETSASAALSSSRASSSHTQRLETVATFGDDFRLVGIGVSRHGRIFAVRSLGG
jgi:hypothetical protein